MSSVVRSLTRSVILSSRAAGPHGTPKQLGFLATPPVGRFQDRATSQRASPASAHPRHFSATAPDAKNNEAPPVGGRSTPNCVTGSAGWPPGLYVFDSFGAPTPEMARGVVQGSKDLITEITRAYGATTAAPDATGPQMASIPQPQQGRISQAHNLNTERAFVSLKVPDPTAANPGGNVDDMLSFRRRQLQCEHFEEYGSKYHALTYFRGNANIPLVMTPILDALRATEVVRALCPFPEDMSASRDAGKGGDEVGLHWKLTFNNYKARAGVAAAKVGLAQQQRGEKFDATADAEALKDAGGALFPWHTDLAANGEITAIATLLAPAMLEFAPYPGAEGEPTRIVANPGTLVVLSGPARWEWVHRAVPHPDAAGKERISLVLGCAHGSKGFPK